MLEQALINKKLDAQDTIKRAEKNQRKVKASLGDLKNEFNKVKGQEKIEEEVFKKEVDTALQVRMREIEQTEYARLAADMRTKRECQRAEAEAKIKMAYQMANETRMRAR